MSCPYEGGTTTAGEPKETQNDYNIERRKPRTFPANKPFGKMYMNYIRSAQKNFLPGARADLNAVPHYFAEEQQQRRIISQLIRSRAHEHLQNFLLRALSNSVLAIHLHTLSGLDYVRMGSQTFDYSAGLVDDAAQGSSSDWPEVCCDRPITAANELARRSQVCLAANAMH